MAGDVVHGRALPWQAQGSGVNLQHHTYEHIQIHAYVGSLKKVYGAKGGGTRL